MRMRAHENSVEARKTLAGIVRIVSKIKGMQLREGVRNKVLGAVRRLEEAGAHFCLITLGLQDVLDGHKDQYR